MTIKDMMIAVLIGIGQWIALIKALVGPEEQA